MDNEKKLVIIYQPIFNYKNVHIFNLVQDTEGFGLNETIAEAGMVYKDNCYVLFGKKYWQEHPDNYFFDYLLGVARTEKEADEKLRTALHNFATDYVRYINEKHKSSLKEAKEFEGWQNVTLEDLTSNIGKSKKVVIK